MENGGGEESERMTNGCAQWRWQKAVLTDHFVSILSCLGLSSSVVCSFLSRFPLYLMPPVAPSFPAAEARLLLPCSTNASWPTSVSCQRRSVRVDRRKEGKSKRAKQQKKKKREKERKRKTAETICSVAAERANVPFWEGTKQEHHQHHHYHSFTTEMALAGRQAGKRR